MQLSECKTKKSNLSSHTLNKWLSEAPLHVSLSSGFFGFFAHLGFVKALYERGIRPQSWSGCSAGAIVSAAMAAEVDIQYLENKLMNLRREDFWDPAFGFGVLKGDKFENLLKEFLPDTFEDLKTPLEIAVFDNHRFRDVSISKGSLTRAVRASGAVPGMFHPVKIENKYYYDGGITNKTAIAFHSEKNEFSHFLHSGNLWDQIELKKLKSKLSGTNKLCRVMVGNNLTPVHPFKLQNGKKALEESYEATHKALESQLKTFYFTK